MESTFKPELWHDLFVMIGSAAGALVGLLFIVMSLHLEKISERADYNMHATIHGARSNTIHLYWCENNSLSERTDARSIPPAKLTPKNEPMGRHNHLKIRLDFGL